jgi:hypothetical protein
MRKTLIIFTALFCIQSALAADPSEEGVPTSPVTVYSGGIAGGAFFPLNDELEPESKSFLKLSFINTVHLTDHMELFLDADWFAPGNNYGMDLGFNFLLTSSGFRPFLGAGVGAHVFDKAGKDFGENFGPSATAHAGFLLDLSDRLQIQVRVPYHFTANQAKDHSIGLDIGFLFSDKFRHVKKLNY